MRRVRSANSSSRPTTTTPAALARATSPLPAAAPAAIVLALALLSTIAAPSARAASNDLDLKSLVKLGSELPTPDQRAAARDDAFQRMTAELGLALTPSPLQPAETTGQSGFDIGIDYGVHTINGNEPYWVQATEADRQNLRATLLQTLGVRARKGFILPVPLTSEVELGGAWLVDSNIFTVGANVRLALNEGFIWLPDVAIMSGVNRAVGTDDLDLTTITFGGSISKGFGVFGSFNLCPFFAYERVLVSAIASAVDPDPTDTGDVGQNVVMAPVEALRTNETRTIFNNGHDRFTIGGRFNYSLLTVSAGVDIDVVRHIDPATDKDSRRVLLQYALRAGLLF